MNWKCQPPWFDELIHPEEKQATLEIQKNSFYLSVTKTCGDIIANAVSIPKMLLTAFPVSKESSPRIYRCYKTALDRLGCKEIYPLYIDFGYELKGSVFGSNENGYSILINTECGEILTDNELTAFLGGEIGHILAGHPQNHALLDNLDKITERIPFGGEIVRNTVLGLFSKWLIASEYTADRAALIACESIDDLISLRKKQMGAGTVPTQQILNQTQSMELKNLGMYFAMMAQELPIIGGVIRLQEICRWVCSKGFAADYAPLLYKLCINSKEIEIPCNMQLFEIHRKAFNDEITSIRTLGKAYMFGNNGLPQCSVTGESFLRKASFMGDAEAMFIEGGCFELGFIKKIKQPETAQMLYRAAASRGERKAQSRVAGQVSKSVPDAVVKAGKEILSRSPEFWLSMAKEQPNRRLLIKALNAFWAPVDEIVFAYDLFETAAGVTGVILTSGGIYGSFSPEEIPYYSSWDQFKKFDLCQMRDDGEAYLYLDDKPICLCKSYIRGTIADLLISIKKNMK